jgi:ribonuclease HI
LGYQASAKKAQICRQTVTYLGYELKEGTRWLTNAMKETILRLPVPTSAREVHEFLETAGYCRLWILGYVELAKPLFKAIKDKAPWAWGPDQQKAFEELKTALLRAPALALPDPLKPFTLFVDERGIAKGVLTQRLVPWKRPVAYLSKRLDPVAAGWPPCLRIIATVALIVKDADKLTFGQHLKVVTPNAVEGVLKHPPSRWMTNAQLTHYQGLLLDAPRILFSEPVSLNPATLLPNLDLEAPLHDCQEIIAEIPQVRPDFQDLALPNSELVWYTDGSSFVSDGVRKAGAVVVDQCGNIIWSALLPPRTSDQKAELIVLAEALERAKGKRVTVYTDSRYVFGTVHIHGAIYWERGFITVEGKELLNLPEIHRLLIAVQKPQAAAIVHVPGHQSSQTLEAMGNRQADEVARNAALASTTLVLTLPMPELPRLPPRPEYTPEDRQWIQGHRCSESNQQGWYHDDEGRLILPEKLGLFLLSNLRRANHLGKKKLLALLQSACLWFPHQTAQIQRIVDQCARCQAMKLSKKGLLHTGTQVRGRAAGQSWEVDY